jgi:hypothetical protein
MSMTLDTSDFTRAADALAARYPDVADDVVDEALTRSAKLVADNVKGEAAKHRKSGMMSSRITVSRDDAGTGLSIRVTSEGKHALWTIGGTKAHRIAPGKVMPLGGGTRFATYVQHPGYRGDPIVNRAIVHSLPGIQDIIDTAAGDMARALAAAVGG